MQRVQELSRDAFALLLRIIEHPSMTIGTEPLFSDFPRLAPELIDAGWLVPAGNDTAPVLPDDDDHSFHELLWDSERKQYKYFTATSGWVYVAADTAKHYVLNDDRLLSFLQYRLDIPKSQRLTCLRDNVLWHLGSARFGGYRAHLYFARRLSHPENRAAFLQAMRREVGKTPAIIMYASKQEPVGLELPVDQAVVSLYQAMARDQADFYVDEDMLYALLKGGPSTEESTGGIGLRFSTDYRMVHWNGGSYKLTKKQSAVVECLHNEGGRAHKDLLRAEARTDEELHRIMRNRKNGKYIPHPLWNTLIKSEGNGYYYLDA
ncbi:MAG: hypothetical protein ABW140_13320 [Candidatus Sedimenticola sp. 6PFRAG1]